MAPQNPQSYRTGFGSSSRVRRPQGGLESDVGKGGQKVGRDRGRGTAI